MSPRRFFLFLLLTQSVLFADTASQDQNLIKNHDMLEVSKNFVKTYDVHKMYSDSQRTLKRINNVNFAMKPRVVPIKPFDSITIHHIYPLKLFLPSGSTVTFASLSGSSSKPGFSQNIISVDVDEDFESGLLDVVYVVGDKFQEALYLSVKLDKYIPLDQNQVEDNKLYTQVKYFKPTMLSNNEILSSLKPELYDSEHSQVTYMGITYDVFLVSVVKDKKTLKEYKDEKYINCGFIYNDKTYNFYIR